MNEYFPITILTSWLRANTYNPPPERTPTWRLEFKFLVCVLLTSLTGTWNCDKDTCHPQRFAECICICICPDWIIPPPSTNALFVQVGKDSLRCSQKFSWFSTQQLFFSYSRPLSSPPPVCLSASSSKFNIHDEATIVGNCNERFEEEHAGRKMVIGD